MEHLLHYTWKHKLFPLKLLQTTDGIPVEILDPGLHNSDAGPDFFNAKLKIGGVLWVGNIEIHTHSSDWYRHGHDKDKAYDSVILHVVEDADVEVRGHNGETIPQLLLTCPQHVKLHYRELCEADRYPACYSMLGHLSKLTIHSWLTALQTERLEQKSKQIADRLKYCNYNWEDAFFITIARNFGFGLNGDAFEWWAKQLPFRALDKHRNDLFQIEAFFFGQAGLLGEAFLKKEEEDEYGVGLRKEFHYLQKKFDLSQTMDPSQWRFLRLRPDNFPHIRLAQLAYLYQHVDSFFSKMMEAETLKDLHELLSTRTSNYWKEHYRFGRSSTLKDKILGENSKNLLVINTVIPFLYAYGLHKSAPQLCDRAFRFLEEMKPENNHIIREWSNAGLPVESAADSQALIQLRKEYCDQRKCLYCRFGYEYLRKT